MSRYLPTLAAGILTVALLAKALLGVREFSREPELVFDGPGEYRLVTPVASPFTVWHASTASLAGVYTVRDQRLPPGTEIGVVHAGEIVPVEVDGSNTVNGNSGDKVSVLRFEAKEPGEYLIRIYGFTERRHFTVTRGNGLWPLFAAVGWFLAGGAGFVVCLLFLILALLRKFPKTAAPAG